ncbi:MULTISPECIES: hypothetical protein [unclassified Streptomyces]|uniref:hypothetical protein n=1 Tax=unclassified Streptomyces TaxID=2593676 RepID=UPI0034433669
MPRSSRAARVQDTADNPLNVNYFKVCTFAFRGARPTLLDIQIELVREHGGGNVSLMAATLT